MSGFSVTVSPNRLYIVAYINRAPSAPSAKPSRLASSFFRTINSSKSWPLDVSDDPAFFSASFLRGPVTWGVCRADVRNAIAVNDWIAFFSATSAPQSKTTIYRFTDSNPQTTTFVVVTPCQSTTME